MNPWFKQEFVKELTAQKTAVESVLLAGQVPDLNTYHRLIGERARIIRSLELFEKLYSQMEQHG